jgi:hypothetical protein
MMEFRKTGPPRERVLLTLLAMADDTGIIERFKREDALDLAHLPSSEFERELKALIAEGVVSELDKRGRSARRFQVLRRERRGDSLAYLRANAPIVTALEAARARVEPGRAYLPPGQDVSLPPIKVLKCADASKSDLRRFVLTVAIAGLGTFRGWIFHEVTARGPAVYPPSRKVGDTWVNVIDPTPELTEAILRVAIEAVAAQAPAQAAS